MTSHPKHCHMTMPQYKNKHRIFIAGCTSEEDGVNGTCSWYVTGIGGETTGDEVVLRETTVGVVLAVAAATGNDVLGAEENSLRVN